MTALRQTASVIVIAGLLAGTIDLGAACLINSAHPVVILHAIASGLIGRSARTGGMSTAALGLVLQWAMSMLIAAIYLGVMASHPERRRRWVSSGILAGIVIFAVMNYLVVPLSAAPFRPPLTVHGLTHAFGATKLVENLLAMILFGLIIGYCARRSG